MGNSLTKLRRMNEKTIVSNSLRVNQFGWFPFGQVSGMTGNIAINFVRGQFKKEYSIEDTSGINTKDKRKRSDFFLYLR